LSKIILQGHIVVPESDIEIVESELANHIELTREEAGCLKFTVEQDPNVTGRFNVYEEFSSREAFDYHQQRVRASYWGKVTKDVERHYKISEQD